MINQRKFSTIERETPVQSFLKVRRLNKIKVFSDMDLFHFYFIAKDQNIYLTFYFSLFIVYLINAMINKFIFVGKILKLKNK